MRSFWSRLAPVVAVVALSATAIVPGHAHDASLDTTPADPAKTTVTVFKAPTCGCCKAWAEHLEKHGFKVVARDLADVTPIKTAHGVPERLRTCHTALVGGYVVEGHVPADLVKRLLKERPKVAGLAGPGMPMGSPGMEGPRQDKYDVLSFRKDGKTAVYARR